MLDCIVVGAHARTGVVVGIEDQVNLKLADKRDRGRQFLPFLGVEGRIEIGLQPLPFERQADNCETLRSRELEISEAGIDVVAAMLARNELPNSAPASATPAISVATWWVQHAPDAMTIAH